ncbi:hypothetical protein C8F04DRAFT_1278541 [Mycena alexandri]|uniref:DUF6532 domain-containing protein n=1 Tax=Mycena alexandri TaxID=1745969 RepID=A0AAD6S097_9AGAR|nr:hypothetical protein C8F04DRAFT_1278541 [Mycena alexandri]
MARQSTLRQSDSTSGSSCARPTGTVAAAANLRTHTRHTQDQDGLEDSDDDHRDNVDRDYAPASGDDVMQEEDDANDDDYQHEEGDNDDEEEAPVIRRRLHYVGKTPAQLQFFDDADSNNEEEAPPVRGRGRVPRMSEKQAQLVEDQQNAKALKQHKAAKAVKAAKRKAGVVEQDTRGPIQDDFTSRTITTTRPTATKNLAQCNSRVPPATKFPSPDWHTSGRRDGSSHHTQDNDIPAPKQTFRGMSPRPPRQEVREPIRNINGGVVPDRVTLQLRQTPPSATSRASSPDAGDKRPRSSSVDLEELRPTQSVKTTTSGGRPRAKDLDEHSKEYAGFAIRRYRAYLGTLALYPEPPMEKELIQRAWDDACVEFGERRPLTPTIYKLLAARGPQLRGEMKTKVRPLTEVMYGFRSGHDKKTIAFNRDLAEKLKEGSRFTMKDVEGKKGLFKHAILQKSCNAIWFANRRDEGPTAPELFNPLPMETLAGHLTVTENTIDEYLTGTRTDIPFTANDYRSVYQTHLHALKEFAEHTAKYKLLDAILVRMHNIGRFHSGAQPIAQFPTSVLSKDVLDAALKEFEEDSETETEGEHGDHSA